MPDVTTSSGVVRGVEEDDLVAWRGIPYAASTAGHRRLHAPQPRRRGRACATCPGSARSRRRRGPWRCWGARRTPMGEDCLSVDVLRRATDRVECDPRRARRQAWTGYANHR
ncbi:carboxylesterase family protein [Pseudonocardia sp.]|uniref:carboxylesterase family protein n=1 Tax=Pseudonocardia sp. TaxID=60912 RepID=UPI0026255DEF|nr:carboxylesterase family protein [Pseudonocardia sp.]MCW2719574.1 carboxylesterase/lipase family protein [Pseudonocardia sp.]